MKKKNIILIIVSILVGILGGFGFYNANMDKSTNEIIESGVQEVVEYIENKSTTEIPELTETDEQTLEVQETESESFELQGNIAYEAGENSNDYDIKLGEYAGLTYYSQVDNRWKNHPYTSTGNASQTIGSSGCGPTSASMIVSSIKGTVTPEVMGDLFVANGYRSANNGTYWSAFRYVADKWNIGYTETSDLQKAVQLLEDNNYIVCSVGNGLFTTGGHFIVLVGVEGEYIKVYDPYLYNGKFETSTRRGKATVSGNTIYVSIDNFRKYANYQNFFCFKNDRTEIKENTTTAIVTNNTTSDVKKVDYKVKVTANKGLNIRKGASTSYSKVGGYAKNSIVTVLAESNGWGKTDKGWISLVYTSKINTTTSTKKITGYKTGNYKVNASVLNVRYGAGTNYKAKNYKQLTANARSQNSRLGNYYTNGYKRGVVCTVTKVNGNWGYTKSGWIYLNYCTKL